MSKMEKVRSRIGVMAIVCYCFIFLKGMYIAMPLILTMTGGILDQTVAGAAFLLLGDLGLLILAVMKYMVRGKLAITLRWIVYFLLLAPLVRLLIIFPLSEFHFALFWGPFAGFVVLYPISVVGRGEPNFTTRR